MSNGDNETPEDESTQLPKRAPTQPSDANAELERKLLAAEDRAANAEAKSQEIAAKLRDSRASFAESRETLRTTLAKTRESLNAASILWRNASKYYSLFFQGILADEIDKSDVDLGADTYLCLLPSTVPAAMNLRRKFGGRIVCDCVENVEVDRQSLAPRLNPSTLDMINLAAYGALASVDGLLTVSNAVGDTLKRFGPPIRVQPNFRRFEIPTPAGTLRSRFGIPADARVAIATGGVVSAFEPIVEAIQLLPSDVHLVAFVKISPADYAEAIDRLIVDLGVEDRVHIAPFVPYEELSGLLADADVGIVALDPSNPNHAVSLPNRIFDFTTAGLPFLSPFIPEIAQFVHANGCGVVLQDTSPQAWSEGLRSLFERITDYREAMSLTRSRHNWDSMDDELFEFLGSPKSVTLIGFRDLSRYQRFLRISSSLSKRGVEVKAVFFSKDPRPMGDEGRNFYYFSERYGVGDGLTPVPRLDDLN